MKTRSVLMAVMLLFAAVLVRSQELPKTFQGQYHMLDSAELHYQGAAKAFTTTAPPTGTVRAIAEWEPAQAVIVSYPGNFGIPYNLIANMSQHTPVITLVQSSAQQSTVTSSYNSNGVNMANCSFVITPLDSYWSRDYSPWFIMVNNSEIAIVDFPYNRPSRPNDDNVPVVMASQLGEDLYGMNVSHTGGNYMCDGMGVAAMTDLVIDENSLTDAQIDTLFHQYMGITTNYITTDPLGEYIKHIDCWGKFLDVDKILIGQVATSNAQYTDYEAMAAWWAAKTSSYGNNYQVYRVYEPNGQPYTNSLILNKTVYVPTVTGTGSSNNTAALNVYQNAMPGYNVVGISYATWESTDALHCRTHEVADKNMLYIKHYPTLNAQNNLSQFPITANIYALSGTNLITDSVWIRYKVNAGSWQQLAMTNTSGNTWTANIPGQTAGDTIRYYIHASDQSPKSVTHPLIGAPDAHKFYIAGSTSVNENSAPASIIFPNPAVDRIVVSVRDENALHSDVFLINSLGKIVMQQSADNPASSLITLDVSHLAAGSYFLRTLTDGRTENTKIMIMH
jgi:agmatine/peptidylarginine deiminase